MLKFVVVRILYRDWILSNLCDEFTITYS